VIETKTYQVTTPAAELDIRVSAWCRCYSGLDGTMRFLGMYHRDGMWLPAEEVKPYRRACLSVGAWLGGVRL
jgi:hypothetical protein